MISEESSSVAPAYPWIGPASYWIPEYIVDSAWLGHAPFIAWLMNELRPRTVLELGTHTGFSYFAMCDFAHRMGLSTSFVAVDTWQGDEHAGFYSEDVFSRVSAWNERYAANSTLLRGTFDEMRPTIDDRSIDLLHIDGRHRYEDVVHDFSAYTDALTDNAVVLFHDIAERSADFGVHRFWDELSERFPTFSFHHDHGLGVALVGSTQTPALRALADADESTAAEIRKAYSALGERVTGIRHLLVQAARADLLDEREATIEVLSDEVKSLSERVEARSREVEEMRASTSWRVSAPVRWIGSVAGLRRIPRRDAR